MAEKYTFAQFKSEYPDDDACLAAIFLKRFGEKPTCQSCGVYESKFARVTGRRAYVCQWCGHHLYPCAGTEFEHSSTPLSLWFHAIYLMTATRNGVSGKELQRQLGVTYKCAWRIGHQLRKLMAAKAAASGGRKLSGHIEVDETYVGGKQPGIRGRGAKGKTVVFGILERDGNIIAKVVPNVKRETLAPIIEANVAPGSVISSDELSTYQALTRKGYKHGTVTHGKKQYVSGIHHVNGVEGFWSHLKKGIRSTHVSVSAKHLQKYVGEFAFRFDNRKQPASMFESALSSMSQPQRK